MPLAADRHLYGQDVSGTESSVLYGEALRVDFVTKATTAADKTKEMLFFDNWLDLNTY